MPPAPAVPLSPHSSQDNSDEEQEKTRNRLARAFTLDNKGLLLQHVLFDRGEEGVDGSEQKHQEERLSLKDMRAIQQRQAHMDIPDMALRNWKLPRRQDTRYEHDPNVDMDSVYEILNAKNKEKTAQFALNMSHGLMDITAMALAMKRDGDDDVHKGPMMLPLLSFVVVDYSAKLEDKRQFKVFLEYGLGERCLRWSVVRSYDQLDGFHKRLVQLNNLRLGSKVDLPHLPKPPKIHHRPPHLLNNNLNINHHHTPNGPIIKSTESLVESLTPPPSIRRLSRTYTTINKFVSKHTNAANKQPKQSLNESIQANLNRQFLENIQLYLEDLAKSATFKSHSLKLFQFFEMSPFSLMLSNEIQYKRKEGTMFIGTTAKKQGWRVGHIRLNDLTKMVDRHTNKWFILGDSFLMYTSDISSTTPLDVFLFDSSTVASLGKQKSNRAPSDNDELDIANEKSTSHLYHSGIEIQNNERKIKLSSTQKSHMDHWLLSIQHVLNQSIWNKPHRFGSFAPPRDDAFAQWFVDGRDYMYAVSSAIEMAKDVIYIHDWWLSPELYLRRPANGNQDWRIDRLLQRKANQGVKIYIIIYRNVGNTVVTDSLYTKHSLLDLSKNIYVLRSPNQIMQNVFFWAHHEKLCIVDNAICFLGGIDLCFGRWDTPDHVLTDDGDKTFDNDLSSNVSVDSKIPPNSASTGYSTYLGKPSSTSTNLDAASPTTTANTNSNANSNINCGKQQIFIGKDYSNPRVKDFFNLAEPFEDMYDRQNTPRMPWHDIHMVSGGQVARDLARHFVQRWNYLLRQKRPSRPTPLLIPPREFTSKELNDLGLKGTCQVQLLRSSGEWSLGLKNHEQSIHDAYIKAIEQSEHFVYIENQFFITSCKYNGVVVKNSIGDALVDRIIQAHKKSQNWRAIIMIPLMPGFESNVDSKDGGSVRLIMQLQYMSISMGDDSIFAKLRRVGIQPEEYIQFYSLRKWGSIGPKKLLTTEQLYIHAKTMIVDDRIAIIGSANINERSMRGVRDSEVASMVIDKRMIDSTMDGKHYKVGHFAHSLRMRLMREHLGVDVDLLDLVERRFDQIEKFARSHHHYASLKPNEGDLMLSSMVEIGTRYLLDLWDDDLDLKQKLKNFLGKIINESSNEDLDDYQYSCSFNHRAGLANKGLRNSKTYSTDNRVTSNTHRNDIKGLGEDHFNSKNFVESKMEFNKFLQDYINDIDLTSKIEEEENSILPDIESILEVMKQVPVEDQKDNDHMNNLRWTMIKRLFYLRKLYSKSINTVKCAKSRPNTSSPLSDLVKPEIDATKLSDEAVDELDKSQMPQIPHVFIDPYSFGDPLDIDFNEGTWMMQALKNTMIYQMVFHCQPDDSVRNWSDYRNFEDLQKAFNQHQEIYCGAQLNENQYDKISPEISNGSKDDDEIVDDQDDLESRDPRVILKRAKMTELRRFYREMHHYRGGGNISSSTVYDHETARKLLGKIRGNLVIFPTRWLKREVEGSHWFYQADKLPPIQIYN